MKINKFLCGFILLVVFVVLPTVSGNEAYDMYSGAVPILLSVMSASPPGAYVVAGLSFLHLLSTVLMSDGDDSTKLSKLDLDKAHKSIMERLGHIDDQIEQSTAQIIEELTHTIKSHPLFESMRIQLEEFHRDYTHNMPLILHSDWSEMKKEAIQSMLKYNSDFRKRLGVFITTYIKPTKPIITSEPVELFFDFYKQKNQLLARENKDCGSESLHYKIYKAYNYIAKGLIDSYTMAIAAHAVQYQQEIRSNSRADANSIRMSGEKLLEELKNNIKDLMSKTKSILKGASRVIKNCGAFNLKEGQNFARLPLVTTVIKYQKNYGGYGPRDEFIPLNINELQCSIDPVEYCTHSQQLIPKEHISFFQKIMLTDDHTFHFYYNETDRYRPLSYATYSDSTFGHVNSSPGLTMKETAHEWLYLCGCYKKESVGVSTQIVKADDGYLVTGVRFRVRKNILYIDIQQGEPDSPITIDNNTVVWKETPEDPKQVKYFNYDHMQIEIDDIYIGNSLDLHENYVYGVQLKDMGKVKLAIYGEDLRVYRNRNLVREKNEIKLDNRDDPQKAPANVNRLISMPPDPTIPSFVKLQTSSLKKDLGRTTIPYIDTREVVTSPPSPIVGLGIYHEAAKGDGGLLALKLFSPSLARFIDYGKFEKIVKPAPARVAKGIKRPLRGNKRA